MPFGPVGRGPSWVGEHLEDVVHGPGADNEGLHRGRTLLEDVPAPGLRVRKSNVRRPGLERGDELPLVQQQAHRVFTPGEGFRSGVEQLELFHESLEARPVDGARHAPLAATVAAAEQREELFAKLRSLGGGDGWWGGDGVVAGALTMRATVAARRLLATGAGSRHGPRNDRRERHRDVCGVESGRGARERCGFARRDAEVIQRSEVSTANMKIDY